MGLGSGQFSYTSAIGLFINIINFVLIISVNKKYQKSVGRGAVLDREEEKPMKKKMKLSFSNRMFYLFNSVVWIVVMLIVLYPLYLVVIVSVALDPDAIIRGGGHLASGGFFTDWLEGGARVQ